MRRSCPDVFAREEFGGCILFGQPLILAHALDGFVVSNLDGDDKAGSMFGSFPADQPVRRNWKRSRQCPFLQKGLGIFFKGRGGSQERLPMVQDEAASGL